LRKKLVLGISGSPRENGNTDIAIKRTLKIIRREKLVDAEFIRLTEFNIKYCRGCRECMQTGKCSIKDDDFQIILEKIMEAELILIGAPVYWNGPPGLMKNFIDRTHGFYIDTKKFVGKKVGIISVAADGGFESNESILFWVKHYGAEIIAKTRLYAREKGDMLQRPTEIIKLTTFARKIVKSL